MYITISDISRTLHPLDCIDNKSGNLKIGLRRITFCLDWYNSPDGYWGIEALLDDTAKFTKVEFSEQTGIAKITPSGSMRADFENQEDFKNMFKFKLDEWTKACTESTPCESYTAVDFMPIKLLNIHCNQIDSTENFLMSILVPF